MKKRLIFSLLFATVLVGSFPVNIMAQDAPNSNVTKRRPDRPVGFSPTPTPKPSIQPVEVKQVQTSKGSFLSQLWDKIKAFFQKYSN